MKLNPYYEIVSDLGLAGGWNFEDHDHDYRPEVKGLARTRPEFAPFLVPLLQNQPGGKLRYYSIQSAFRKLFAYAIPTPAAIRAIATLGSVVEIGAGTGYWASLLEGAGATVEAYDNGSWKLEKVWHEVKRGGSTRAGQSDAACLLLCWPPFKTSMALAALAAFRGEFVAYVGEGEGGCTGCDKFHATLDRDWEISGGAPVSQWRGLHDRLEIYGRRNGRHG